MRSGFLTADPARRVARRDRLSWLATALALALLVQAPFAVAGRHTPLTVAAAVLSLDKSAPTAVPYPAATVLANSTGAIVTVGNASYLSPGQSIRIAGETRQIVSINGKQVTVNSAIPAAIGNPVHVSYTYDLAYANSGDEPATSVSLVDDLPDSVTFISASGGGVHTSGAVTWSLGTLDPGGSGEVQVTVLPNAQGAYTNNASIDSAETEPVTDSATTVVGGLRVFKSTDTPTVTQVAGGATATYIVEVRNDLALAADGVVIRDLLPEGFSYASTTGFAGGARTSPTPEPAVGDLEPEWGTFSIPAQATLTLSFVVSIHPSVGPGTYHNAVQVTSTNSSVSQFDPLKTTAEDVTVLAPVVTLEKTVAPESAIAGGQVSYTIVARNTGTAAAQGIAITDDLPSGFAFVGTTSVTSVSATRPSISNPPAGTNTPTWGSWTIQQGGSVTIVFVAGVGTATGIFPNDVTATGANTVVSPLEDVAAVTVLPQPGAIAGGVYNDLNGDGDLDEGEPGLGNVTVCLNPGNICPTTTGDGSYIFSGLAPGEYTVSEIDPPGFRSTGDADGADPNEIFVTVAEGETVGARDFFDQQPTSQAVLAFTAVRQPGGVLLAWTVDEDGTVDGYNILRSEAADGEKTLVTPQAKVSQGAGINDYSHLDASASRAKEYWYWIQFLPSLDLYGPIHLEIEPSRLFLPLILR